MPERFEKARDAEPVFRRLLARAERAHAVLRDELENAPRRKTRPIDPGAQRRALEARSVARADLALRVKASAVELAAMRFAHALLSAHRAADARWREQDSTWVIGSRM